MYIEAEKAAVTTPGQVKNTPTSGEIIIRDEKQTWRVVALTMALLAPQMSSRPECSLRYGSRSEDRRRLFTDEFSLSFQNIVRAEPFDQGGVCGYFAFEALCDPGYFFQRIARADFPEILAVDGSVKAAMDDVNLVQFAMARP